MNALQPTVSENTMSSVSDDGVDTALSDQNRSPSSTPEPGLEPGIWSEWSPHMRQQLELSFTMQVDFPINNDWKTTESYVAHKDEQMLHYLSDYPVRQWIIRPEEALAAYRAMLDRHNLRVKGLSVFHDGKPSWWPLAPQLLPGHRPQAAYTAHQGPAPLNAVEYLTAAVPVSNSPAVNVSEQIRLLRLEGRQSRHPLSNSVDSPRARSTRPPVPLFNPTSVPITKSVSPATYSEHIDQARQGPRSRKKAITSANISNDEQVQIQLPLERGDSSEQPKFALPKLPRASRHSAIREVTPPPYERHIRPSAVDESEPIRKSKRREGFHVSFDKPEFPWQTEYAAERPTAWNDGIYSPERLQAMEMIRIRNQPKIDKYYKDKEEAKSAKKAVAHTDADDTDADEEGVEGTSKKMRPKPRKRQAGEGSANDDPYHSSHLSFWDKADAARCTQSGFASIRDALQAAMINPKHKELAEVLVFMDPGDRPLINDLEVAPISIMDIARTRLQFEHLRVFPDLAAWRMIDFCPDMLHEYNLLKIIGETSYSNGMIRERLSLNGFPCSDSTITKRVTSAVEKKKDSKAGSKANAMDKDWRTQNRVEHNKYKWYHLARRAHSDNLEDPSTFDLATAAEKHISRMKQHGSLRERESSTSTMTDLYSRPSTPVAEADSKHSTTVVKRSPKLALPTGATASQGSSDSDPQSTIRVNNKRSPSAQASPSSSDGGGKIRAMSPAPKRRRTRYSVAVWHPA